MTSRHCAITGKKDLERLLRPRSIALVGASSTPGSLGESVLSNLEASNFAGELYLVNPKRPIIHGRQCLGSIDELPAGIDCAVLAIPGAAILSAVKACAEKQCGSAIVFSAGFAEGGEDGRSVQQELSRIAQESGMVIEGPNCLGTVNYIDGIPLTFVVTPPQERTDGPGAAIISQSGALACVVAVNMRKQKIPLTYSISTGNEAESNVEDFVEHLMDDAATRVIALIVEQFREPRRLLKLAARVLEKGKFIALLHPGRSKAARVSATTHTGAIAGDYEVMRTMVAHAGLIHVDSLEEFVDVTQLLVRSDLPRGGCAIFTESGAFKALAFDLCEVVGLDLPLLSPQTESALRDALPAFIPPSNPLDLTAQGLVDPTLYRRTLPAVLNDDRFGSVLLGIILTDPTTRDLKLNPIKDAIGGCHPHKPIIFAALDEGAPFESDGIDALRALGVACFPSAERAIRALAHVTRLGVRLAEREAGRPAASRKIRVPGYGNLTEFESKKILAEICIPIPAGDLAKTPEQALEIAREIGFPVVLKAQSPCLLHKTEVGGVAIGIQSEEALRQTWTSMIDRVQSHRPGLELDGLLVEKMSSPGTELIIGARNDPQWGPILLVGFGGIFAEAFRDVRLLPAGLSLRAIKNELLQLRCSTLLKGFRSTPPADIDAIADLVLRLDDLVQANREIVEVDINPVLVRAAGKGVLALDASISLVDEPATQS